MTKKKNGFLTFCCSLIPGAGEMYMGFMKMGVSLMGIFFLIMSLAVMLELEALVFFGVIVWCYSFFHVHNLVSMPDEEFYAVEDEFLIHLSEDRTAKDFVHTYRNIIAFVLIFIGVILIWNSMYWIIVRLLPEGLTWIIREIGYRLPKLIVGAAVIVMGFYMISGKKKSLKSEQEDTAKKEEA